MDVLKQVVELQEAITFDDPFPFEFFEDIRPLIKRIKPESALLSGEEIGHIRHILELARKLKSYVERRAERYPHLHQLVKQIVALPDLEAEIRQVIDERGRIQDTASPELARLRKALHRLRTRLRQVVVEELQRALEQGYAADARPTLRNGRMVIPIRAEAKRKVQGFIHDTSASGHTVYIEPARALELNNEVRETEIQERREVERILREVTRKIHFHLPAIEQTFYTLGAFDVLYAKAQLSKRLGAVIPSINREGVVSLVEAKNPALMLHFQHQAEVLGRPPQEVVPLSLELGKAYWTLLITGPNAGGKTVAMKTVGLLSLMLSYGIPVPVDPKSDIALFEAIMVDIGDEQSLEEDLSTFSAHVSRLNYMLQHATEQTLQLIDEAGTGTDPEEGAALAQAVLESLTHRKTRTIATTHHGALKVFAFETPGVENGSMQFDPETLRPTYRFIPGVPGSSYAFEIARRVGLPESIIQRAQSLVGRQRTALDELIRKLEERLAVLEKELEEARQQRAQAEQLRKTYEARVRQWEEQKAEMREKALQEIQHMLAEANARIERTIREIKEHRATREATQRIRQALETYQAQVHGEVTRLQQRKSKKASGKTLKVGDHVVVDEGNTIAEILELKGDEAVLGFGTMRMRVKRDRLKKVPRARLKKQQREARATDILPALRASHRIDVRGKRVAEAVQEVTRFLDEAVAADLKQVEILHGKGTGALRKAIWDLLASYPEIASFEEAPPQQGGAGVTVITFK